MEWAKDHADDWRTNYYLALNYWGKGRMEEAKWLLDDIRDQADFSPFYLARAQLNRQNNPKAALLLYTLPDHTQCEQFLPCHLRSQYFYCNLN